MGGSDLIAILVVVLLVHFALAHANRRHGSAGEYTTGLRMSALLTRIATEAAMAGWGALVLGLALDAVHVHALSTVLAATVVVMVPLSLLCLLASLILRFAKRSSSFVPGSRRAYRRAWRFSKALITLLGTVLLALVSLVLLMARKIAEGIQETAAEPHPEGLFYNARTNVYDDGTDPNGVYG